MTNRVNIGNFGDGYVEYIESENANANENSRVDWTTKLAAISRGKDKSANPIKRYASLMEEAEGKNPSRPFEFLPIVLKDDKKNNLLDMMVDDWQVLSLIKFGYLSDINFDENTYLCTNMRACINAGIPYEKIPYNEKINDFAAFKIKAPMFVWAQIVTHTQLSTESQSDRVAEELNYWIPDDLIEKLKKLEHDNDYVDEITQKVYMDTIELADDITSGNIATTYEGFVSYMINTASQRDVQILLKALGYPREIWSRAPYYFKMKEFVITGWINDDNAWPHFLRERNAYMNDGGPKNWTQPETQKYAEAIRKLLENKKDFSKDKILQG